jgi:alpha-tubulin suppressor-like RCC1 family protein
VAALALAAVVTAGAAPPAAAEQAGAPTGAERTQAGHLDSGDDHTCVVVETGRVRCWGKNYSGQLGYGNVDLIGDDESPSTAGTVDLGPGRTATAISAGGDSTCAILDTGKVKCWGDNFWGQLGYGHTNNIGDDEPVSAAADVNLGVNVTAKAISVGDSHTCAITNNDDVMCWGWSGLGQLGYGNQDDIGDDESPAAAGTVSLGAGLKAAAVTAGDEFTCVILTTGEVKCWGYNSVGQLGYGHTNDIGDDETPASESTVSVGGTNLVTAISAGNHTCVIRDDGLVVCWGPGGSGGLGYGNTNTIGDNETPSTAGTLKLGVGLSATDISVGENHSCASMTNYSLRCWGEGIDGRLGYGNQNDIGDNETPVQAGFVPAGNRGVTAVTTGEEHTCGRMDSGRIRCWGEALFGQLGYGNTTDIGDNETPDSVSPVVVGALVN